MSMTMLLRRMGRGEVTVHGFRSAFRDWAAEVAHAPREVAEAALAHAVGNKVEAAYARGDLLIWHLLRRLRLAVGGCAARGVVLVTPHEAAAEAAKMFNGGASPP